MSSPAPHPSASPASTVTREVIASYTEYVDAQAAVDRLSDREFPVASTQIVGHDVKTVETVTGRVTTSSASFRGAASGAWFGLMLGLLFGIFTPGVAWLGVLLVAVGIGALWGAIAGFVGHWATRGQRDFSSIQTLSAGRYDVMVERSMPCHSASAGMSIPLRPGVGACGSPFGGDTPGTRGGRLGPTAPGSLPAGTGVPVDDDVQLISDGDGLAVIGEPSAVERFLATNDLPAGRDLGLERWKPVAGLAAAAMQAGSVVAENHGRWVKLSEKSTELLKTHDAMKGSLPALERGVIMDGNKIKGIVEFARGPGTYLTNPAVLSGAAGIMAQYAMQQAMDEISDYLAVIDAKVDDILRGQKDAVLADMIGVDMVLEEATVIREQVGRVSETTWSKVQGTALTVGRTQGYALRQLDALAEKMERTPKVDDLAPLTKSAETTVRDWLAVLARCFQLQDTIGVLELDRVLDASPEELDQHRLALRAVRQNRLTLIGRTTDRLLERMDTAAGTANAKVLLNPINSRAVVGSSNHVASGVVRFNGLLGVAGERESLEARRWLAAVGDTWDLARDQGAEGVDAARRIGAAAFGRGRAAADGLSMKLAAGALRRRRGAAAPEASGDDET